MMSHHRTTLSNVILNDISEEIEDAKSQSLSKPKLFFCKIRFSMFLFSVFFPFIYFLYLNGMRAFFLNKKKIKFM